MWPRTKRGSWIFTARRPEPGRPKTIVIIVASSIRFWWSRPPAFGRVEGRTGLAAGRLTAGKTTSIFEKTIVIFCGALSRSRFSETSGKNLVGPSPLFGRALTVPGSRYAYDYIAPIVDGKRKMRFLQSALRPPRSSILRHFTRLYSEVVTRYYRRDVQLVTA